MLMMAVAMVAAAVGHRLLSKCNEGKSAGSRQVRPAGSSEERGNSGGEGGPNDVDDDEGGGGGGGGPWIRGSSQ